MPSLRDDDLKGKEPAVHPDQLQTVPVDLSPLAHTMFGCPPVQEALVKPPVFHETKDSILNGTTRNLDSFAVPQEELPLVDASNTDKPEESEQERDPTPEIEPCNLLSVFDQEVKGLHKCGSQKVVQVKATKIEVCSFDVQGDFLILTGDQNALVLNTLGAGG